MIRILRVWNVNFIVVELEETALCCGGPRDMRDERGV